MDRQQPRQSTLGVGKYRARRVGDKIILHAVGETPTPNYKAWLRKPGSARQAADYELWWMPPADTSIELPTPFSVHVSFRAGVDANLVRVHDATGVHAVEVEVLPEPSASSTALVFLHYANQFDLHYHGKEISFTQANVAGDPLLSYGERYFYGDQIELQDTAVGELVSVTLEERPRGERWRLSLVLPRTWVSSYESATIEAMVIETVIHGLVGGPPAGQEIEYERADKVTGHATFIVS